MEIMNFVLKPPIIKSDYVYRENLINEMLENKEKKVLLLKAPFGFGKTISLGMYYEKLEENKLWISCPENYFDFNQLLNHLMLGLTKIEDIKFKWDYYAYDYFNEEEKVGTLLSVFSKIKRNLYIFFDGFENIKINDELKPTLNLLINFSNENIHFIFSSKESLPISLLKLEMNDNVCVFEENDLKFTFEEFEVFLNKRKIKINKETLLKLYSIFDGWPGLIMIFSTAISENKLSLDKLDKYELSTTYDLTLYLDTLFNTLDEDLLKFLCFISLLNNIDTNICKKYFNFKDEIVILEYLEKLVDLHFLEKLDDQNYYIPEIIKNYIRNKMQDPEKEKIYEELQNIYRKENNFIEQFYCIMQIGNIEETIIFFMQHSEELIKDFSFVESWLDSLPQSTFDKYYILHYYRGLVKEKYSKFDEALNDYIIAKQNFDKINEKNFSIIDIEIQIIGIYWHKEEYEKVRDLCMELLKKIHQENENYKIPLYNLLGTSLSYLSNLDDSEKYLNEALLLCEKCKNIDMKPWILNNLAYNVYLVKGDLKKAEESYNNSLEIFKNIEDTYGKALLYANLTDFYLEINNKSKAQQMLNFFKEIYLKTQNIAYLPIANILQAKIDLRSGSLKEADKHLKEAESFSYRSKFLMSNYLSVLADYLFKVGKSEESLSTLDKAIKIGSTFFNKYQILDFELQKVNILLFSEKYESALPIIDKIIKTSSEGQTKLILAEALFYKIALSYFLRFLMVEEEQNLFLELIKNNDYYFIFDKNPYLSKYVHKILDEKIEMGSIKEETKKIINSDSFIGTFSEKEKYSYFPKVYLFGEFKLVFGNNLLSIKDIKNKKALDLFKFIVLNFDKWLSQDMIIEYFWKDLPFDKARQTLYVALHDIRKKLKEMGLEEELIISQNKNYKFNNQTPYYLDYEEFLNSFKEATKLFNNKLYLKAKEKYILAKNLYNVGLLPSNIYDDWAISKINHAQEIYLQILSKLYTIEKGSDIERSRIFLEEYLNIDPYSYEMNTEYIKLLLMKRDVKRAVNYYNYVKEIYSKDLGMEFPSKEILNFISEFQI